MIYIAITLLIISIILFLVKKFVIKNKIMTIISSSVLGISIVLGFFSTIATVPAGNIGVQTLFGKVIDNGLNEGLHFINPFYQVNNLSIQAFSQKEVVQTLSNDGLKMPVEVSVITRLDALTAPWVWQNLNGEWYQRIVKPSFRSAVRDVLAKYESKDAYSTKRDELAPRIKNETILNINENLAKYKLKSSPAIIENMLVRNISLPKKLITAIELKLEEEQNSQRMHFTLAKERQEAERKKIEAKGIQDFQTIVSKGIDEKLLRWKGIEATMKLAESDNAKVVVVGGADGLPLILNTAK